MIWSIFDFIKDYAGWIIVFGFAYLIMNRPSTAKPTDNQSSLTGNNNSTRQNNSQAQQAPPQEQERPQEQEVTVVPPPAQYQENNNDEDDSRGNRDMSIDDALESRR